MDSTRPVAIVTGAATGVGAAAARQLASRGYRVIVNYARSAQAAEAVAADCRGHGEDAVAMRGDVASDADCRALAAAALERWGRIDVLVNSAGTTRFVPMADLEAMASEDFAPVFAVNALGPFQMARACVPAMRATGAGAIVNVSSTASLTGSGSSWAYVASKGALNALTLGLARQLAPQVRVNGVLPGMIEGRWLQEGLGDEAYRRVREQFAAGAALATVCTPEQVAQAAVWLACDATVMTGQLLTVDAGFLLGRAAPAVSR
jgi:3-oxoacyl-[acyl-carrier protein] reductase